MNIKNVFFLMLMLEMGTSYAICKRENHNHVNKNVVRCAYHQEDIYRCYAHKVGFYKNEERRKECFFCGCPIEEHTKLMNQKKSAAIKK